MNRGKQFRHIGAYALVLAIGMQLGWFHVSAEQQFIAAGLAYAIDFISFMIWNKL